MIANPELMLIFLLTMVTLFTCLVWTFAFSLAPHDDTYSHFTSWYWREKVTWTNVVALALALISLIFVYVSHLNKMGILTILLYMGLFLPMFLIFGANMFMQSFSNRLLKMKLGFSWYKRGYMEMKRVISMLIPLCAGVWAIATFLTDIGSQISASIALFCLLWFIYSLWDYNWWSHWEDGQKEDKKEVALGSFTIAFLVMLGFAGITWGLMSVGM